MIYISTAIRFMDQAELTELLDQSKKRNTDLGITGILLYADCTFIQALEGDKYAVEKVFESIKKDGRHKNVIELISGEQEKPTFPNWAMAFATPEALQMNELEGYINPLQNELFKGSEQNTAITILKTFAENNGMMR